jgi:hypothetical protein
MAKSLKKKVTDALREALGRGTHIELEDAPNGKVGGIVLSRSFAKKSPTERQDHIWKYLDASLTPHERTRVTFIVADTPEEYEALKRAAG